MFTITRFCYIKVLFTISGVKKIVCYTGICYIWVILRFHCMMKKNTVRDRGSADCGHSYHVFV